MGHLFLAGWRRFSFSPWLFIIYLLDDDKLNGIDGAISVYIVMERKGKEKKRKKKGKEKRRDASLWSWMRGRLDVNTVCTHLHICYLCLNKRFRAFFGCFGLKT